MVALIHTKNKIPFICKQHKIYHITQKNENSLNKGIWNRVTYEYAPTHTRNKWNEIETPISEYERINKIYKKMTLIWYILSKQQQQQILCSIKIIVFSLSFAAVCIAY